jgi:hypothetical protein
MMNAVYFDSLTDDGISYMFSRWKREAPGGACLALVAESGKHNIAALQQIANKTGYPLLGAMFPELIANGDFHKQGVVLMHFSQRPRYWLLPELPQESDALNRQLDELVASIRQSSTLDSSLFMVFDGMVPNIATILEKLYLRLTNDVHYFGVNAGSESFQPMPSLFDNEQFVGNGLLACLLPNHPGAMLAHDYRMPTMQVTATAAEGNRITSINWRPAFEVYQEMVQQHYGVEITAANFYEYGVHFPFGINRLEGDPLVRIPVALQDDGSLFCVGEVPANTLLTVLNAVPAGSDETAGKVGDYAREIDGKVALSFYCAGRRMHLNGSAAAELHSLVEHAEPKQLFGALSLGEIGSAGDNKYPLFHNAALIAAPWQ